MKSRSVVITDNATGKQVECPVYEGAYGAPVIDIKNLYKELGMFTFDLGYGSTASCRSAITYLDGEEGLLMHRGYPIEQLAEQSTFTEVAYLLINGELPNQQQHDEWNRALKMHGMTHEHLSRFYTGYRYDAHPMSVLAGVVAAVASYYHDETDIYNPADRILTARRVIGKMPSLISKIYRHQSGLPFVYPDNSRDYVENFMYMMFSWPTESYLANPVAVRALDLLFILHADHEQNASTSTVRLAGSAETNPFACVAAGVTTLWGKSHGGANEAVIKMLEEIGHPTNIQKFVDRAKDKNDNFRLMGFGHRVYKNYDPRAKIIRQACHDLLDEMHLNSELFDIAMELERIALEDPYFIERKLYPNVDFYSGLIYQALNIPTDMFTPMFALARSAGWIAQWMEMMADPDFRIGRPRQLYIGAKQRDYVPLAQRT
ncbi:MAG: citrate synthase [Gammaproteobacteria bacterium]|nr:citrate synthase [Gammaproteobacteria bacterium]MBI5614995.1 citrate synthase [Gammaproteobacteria bacterium]